MIVPSRRGLRLVRTIIWNGNNCFEQFFNSQINASSSWSIAKSNSFLSPNHSKRHRYAFAKFIRNVGRCVLSRGVESTALNCGVWWQSRCPSHRQTVNNDADIKFPSWGALRSVGAVEWSENDCSSLHCNCSLQIADMSQVLKALLQFNASVM